MAGVTGGTSTPAAEFRFCHTERIRMADTDAQGIVHHARYVVLCEAGRTEYMRHLGLDYTVAVQELGLEMAVSTVNLKYRAPARFDDIVDIWVRVSPMRRVSLTYAYELRCAKTNTLFVTGDTDIACLRRDTWRPARIPDGVQETLRAYEGDLLDDRSRVRARV